MTSGMRAAGLRALGLAFALWQAMTPGGRAGEPARAAETVFRNGKVYTLEPQQPWAECVAVQGNAIVYVGSDAGGQEWIGTDTRVIDLHGRMLMPGFVDGHNHYVAGAIAKRGVRLVGSKTKAELLRRIRDDVRAHPDQPVYMGFGWEFAMFGGDEGTRQDLDAICPDRPMIFFNEDNHHGWFNTRAMTVAGVTRDTPDPIPGSSFLRREPDGTPTGMAIEPEAWMPIAIKIGVLGGKDALRPVMDEVFPLLPKIGITAYHDMGIFAPDLPQADVGFELLLEKERAGTLPCRVVGNHGIRNAKASPEEHMRTLTTWNRQFRSELVQVTGVKIWGDGTFLTHTSAEIEPYADDPKTSGHSDWTTDVLARWFALAYDAGFDVNVHVDGNLTTRRCLDAVERVAKSTGMNGRRTNLHHLTLIHPDDLPRFRPLGVGANMTPVWIVDYKGLYQEANRMLGADRVARQYNLARPLVEAGVNLSFGSDIPGTDVEEANPLFQIQAAVTGRVPGSTSTVVPPASRLPSLEQMLHGYTLAGARQMRLDAKIGSLKAGKLADLIVLERNLFDVPPAELAATKVRFTMMNGKVTHDDGL